MRRTTVLRAADRMQVPWKNGGGRTAVVAAHPASAGEDWDWRVSVAEVTTDGAFSPFPGVERTLTVLRGTLALRDVNGAERVMPAGHAWRFDGDVPVWGRPIGGGVTDLNVMVRRTAYTAVVEHVAVPRDAAIALRAPVLILFFSDAGHVALNGRTIALHTFDALLVEDGTDAAIAVTARGPVHVIALTSCPLPDAR